MTNKKPPKICPSCGLEGSLKVKGHEYVCIDDACGRSFPIYPKYGLAGPPKRKSESKSK